MSARVYQEKDSEVVVTDVKDANGQATNVIEVVEYPIRYLSTDAEKKEMAEWYDRDAKAAEQKIESLLKSFDSVPTMKAMKLVVIPAHKQ